MIQHERPEKCDFHKAVPRAGAEKALNDALSRKKTDDFSRRREEALRDALERRRRDLDAKRRELKTTKQEASRVEGLRRRAEAEAASLRAKADVLKKQRVDAEKKLRAKPVSATAREEDRRPRAGAGPAHGQQVPGRNYAPEGAARARGPCVEETSRGRASAS